jgi:hypothetical protein
MTDRENYFIPYDDTIDQAIWSMRDGLETAIADARNVLKKFPEGSLLSVQIRMGTEKVAPWNHTKECLEVTLDTLNEALEDRFFAAMGNTFIPYPRNSGEPESFGTRKPEAYAFGKVRSIVYPHLVLLAKKISEARLASDEAATSEQISAPRKAKQVPPESVVADLLKEIGAGSAS